jgi:hypothetical protein
MQDMGVLWEFVFAKSLFEFSTNSQVGCNNNDNAGQKNGMVFLNHAIGNKKYSGSAQEGDDKLLFSRGHFHGYAEGPPFAFLNTAIAYQQAFQETSLALTSLDISHT